MRGSHLRVVEVVRRMNYLIGPIKALCGPTRERSYCRCQGDRDRPSLGYIREERRVE